MQTDQTRLVIHTGDVPKSSAGDRQTGRVRSRRKTDADRAGSVVIMGADESFAGKTARDRHRDHAKRAQGRLRPEASGHSGAARSGDAARLPKAPAACADGKNSVMPQRIGRTRLFAKRPPHCDAALRRAEQSGATLGAQNAADPEARSNAREDAAPGAQTRSRAIRRSGKPRATGRRSNRPRLTFGERLLRNSAVACALLLALLAAKNIDTPWTRATGRRSNRPRLTFGERLLRNSAVACALLLALLAAKNIDTPWTRAAVDGVERALTMRIDLDESLGRLSFVRNLMPESMLVFFDLSGEGELAAPVEGELDKRYDAQRPWLEFACAPGADVTAAEAGTVLAVTQLSGGGWGVLIEHADGLETVSAYLLEPVVQAGEAVERGQVIARSEAGRLYFEARRNGALIDPAELLGL